MNGSIEKALMVASCLMAILMGLLLVTWDIPITFGLLFVNYKDPYHQGLVDALLNSPLAGLLHLLLFIGSIMLYLRILRGIQKRNRNLDV